jgi:hypothetical protein
MEDEKPEDRFCWCGAKLSRYNPNNECHLHLGKNEWTIEFKCGHTKISTQYDPEAHNKDCGACKRKNLRRLPNNYPDRIKVKCPSCKKMREVKVRVRTYDAVEQMKSRPCRSCNGGSEKRK